MFKQITNLNGNEWYLIASLLIFLLFFIIVGVLLIRMNKSHIDYMSEMPLEDSNSNYTDQNEV